MMSLFVLLVIYQFKHFIADYPLQGKFMLGKFKGGKDWILPLLAHVGVHALFTATIALIVRPKIALQLALLDATIHFIMDRIKASPNLLGRYKALSAAEYAEAAKIATGVFPIKWAWMHPDTLDIEKNKAATRIKHNTYFWWALGLDQLVHHLTDLLVVYLLVS